MSEWSDLDIKSLLHGVQGGVVQQTLEPWVLTGLGLGQRVEYDIVDIALLAAGVFLGVGLTLEISEGPALTRPLPFNTLSLPRVLLLVGGGGG